jgi:hypothetical protein
VTLVLGTARTTGKSSASFGAAESPARTCADGARAGHRAESGDQVGEQTPWLRRGRLRRIGPRRIGREPEVHQDLMEAGGAGRGTAPTWRAATPRRTGPPVLRRALCRCAAPPTPVSDRVVIGRLLPAIQRPSLFGWQVGAHGCPFGACSGFTRVAARQLADPPHGGPMSRGLRQVGCPSRRLGSYRGVPTIPQAGLAPARARHLHGAQPKWNRVKA